MTAPLNRTGEKERYSQPLLTEHASLMNITGQSKDLTKDTNDKGFKDFIDKTITDIGG